MKYLIRIKQQYQLHQKCKALLRKGIITSYSIRTLHNILTGKCDYTVRTIIGGAKP